LLLPFVDLVEEMVYMSVYTFHITTAETLVDIFDKVTSRWSIARGESLALLT
jgi:hypothetical protein